MVMVPLNLQLLFEHTSSFQPKFFSFESTLRNPHVLAGFDCHQFDTADLSGMFERSLEVPAFNARLGSFVEQFAESGQAFCWRGHPSDRTGWLLTTVYRWFYSWQRRPNRSEPFAFPLRNFRVPDWAPRDVWSGFADIQIISEILFWKAWLSDPRGSRR